MYSDSDSGLFRSRGCVLHPSHGSVTTHGCLIGLQSEKYGGYIKDLSFFFIFLQDFAVCNLLSSLVSGFHIASS